MRAIVVVTTVGTEEQANLIGRELVARRLAACVNVLPGVRSIYRWQGKICTDSEFLLVIKTVEREFSAIQTAIGELHSYELPEILSFRVAQGEPEFLRWVESSVDKSAPFAEEEEDDEDHEASPLVFNGVDLLAED